MPGDLCGRKLLLADAALFLTLYIGQGNTATLRQLFGDFFVEDFLQGQGDEGFGGAAMVTLTQPSPIKGEGEKAWG